MSELSRVITELWRAAFRKHRRNELITSHIHNKLSTIFFYSLFSLSLSLFFPLVYIRFFFSLFRLNFFLPILSCLYIGKIPTRNTRFPVPTMTNYTDEITLAVTSCETPLPILTIGIIHATLIASFFIVLNFFFFFLKKFFLSKWKPTYLEIIFPSKKIY